MRLHSLSLLLAAAGLLTGLQTVKAQKVVLHMAGNQKAEYSTQQLDSITFVDVTSPDVEPSTDPSITGDAIDITNKSATLIGYATSIRESLANDLRVGFIYCLEGTPSKNNGTQITVNKNDVAEDGRYMATIENLLSNATYYFRSFVYQSGLWFYGKVKSFITEGIDVNFTTGDATDITCFSAKVSGSVNIKSSYSTIEYGICYGTSIEPTIDNNKVIAASESFTLQLRQLTGGTDYYYRPYIIVDGQAYYGTARTFHTLDDNVVETGDIDEETLTVTSHLTIGGGAYSSLVLGVCYGTTELPTINDNTVTSNEVDEDNNYTIQLVNPGHNIYYYRAYILIDDIPHYGAVKSFNTTLIGEWRGDFGMYYDYIDARGRCYTFDSYNSYLNFTPAYSRALYGRGTQVDYYDYGPYEYQYYKFNWSIENGNIYLSYDYDHQLDTRISNYRMTNHYFTGTFASSGTQFRLYKVADYYNWTPYVNSYGYKSRDNWDYDNPYYAPSCRGKDDLLRDTTAVRNLLKYGVQENKKKKSLNSPSLLENTETTTDLTNETDLNKNT